MTRASLVVLVAAFFCWVGPAAAQGRDQQAPLPDVTGKALLQAECTQCHGVSQINRSGYTEQGWRNLFSSMVELPEADAAVVAEYLAANFPEKPERRPVVIPGNVSVSIQEWMVPTRGQRPHDPLYTADGSIWWTGQWIHVLGRLNPATGDMKEFPLPDNSGPHGLAADPAGNIWYTGNRDAHVGKLNPETGEVTVYPTTARDPHTPIFDQKGTLWFTSQGANMVGRLVPATGELKEVPVPTEGARPYGIAVNSEGIPWVGLNGTNKLASVDPDTMEIREYTLPNPETTTKRLALTSDDVIWYADAPRGYLGRFDPKTGETKEWLSPSGPGSSPYGIAAVGNIIWYNESGPRPNTLVRFDPSTEQFQSWIIESGGVVVRNMMATPDGNLVLAQSGVNRVGLVVVKRDASSQ